MNIAAFIIASLASLDFGVATQQKPRVKAKAPSDNIEQRSEPKLEDWNWGLLILVGVFLAAAATATRKGNPPNPKLICPHCQTRGNVTAQDVEKKVGISGGKVTGALLTGGFSLLATGLSRKETRTELNCGSCGMKWLV